MGGIHAGAQGPQSRGHLRWRAGWDARVNDFTAELRQGVRARRGALLHVAGDLVQSLGVALAGALIWWKQARALPSLGAPLLWALLHPREWVERTEAERLRALSNVTKLSQGARACFRVSA